MRSFIIAVVILTSIVTMVLICSHHTASLAEDILKICDSSNAQSSADTAERLLSEWRSCKTFFYMTVHRNKLEAAENAIIAMNAYVHKPEEFRYHLSVLKETLKSISESGKPDLKTLF